MEERKLKIRVSFSVKKSTIKHLRNDHKMTAVRELKTRRDNFILGRLALASRRLVSRGGGGGGNAVLKGPAVLEYNSVKNTEENVLPSL